MVQKDGPQAIPNFWRGIHVDAALQADDGVCSAVIHYDFNAASRSVPNTFQGMTSFTVSRRLFSRFIDRVTAVSISFVKAALAGDNLLLPASS